MAPRVPAVQSQVWTGTPSPVWGNPAVSLSEEMAMVWYGSSPEFQLVDASTNTPTVTDSETVATLGLAFTNIVNENESRRGNDEGLLSAIFPATGSTTATELVTATLASGALSFTVTSTGLSDWIGCRPLGDSTGSGAYRSPSPYSTYYVYEYDLTGTLAWSTSYAAGPVPIYHPRSERFVTDDSGTLELRNSAATVLSTLAYTVPSGDYVWLACGRNQVALVSMDGTTSNLYVRVLSTAGDTLSWLTSTMTIPTDWDAGANVGQASSWQGQITVTPQFVNAARSIYWINPLTNRWTSSTTNSAGVGRSLAVGTYRTLFYDGGSGTTWNLWRGAPEAAAPRPIGTSYHLRQRQTPYIT